MAAERDLELLDDYLANRLDGKERSAFEQKLNTNPDLKAELDFQQQMISGIKKARISELKGMLNNIPVPVAQTTGTVVGVKVAAWAVVIGLIGTGTYLYFDKNSGSVPEKATRVEETVTPDPADKQDNVNPVTEPHEGSPVVSSQESSSEAKPQSAPAPVTKDKTNDIRTPSKPDGYDPTNESQEVQPSQEEKNVVFGANESLKPSVEVKIESDNKKYNFHYQFKNGQLFLYGPFEKNVYGILEFFNEDKRTLFLYYNDQYFLLKESNVKLKALTPIEDAELIKKLTEYRD